MAQDLQPAPLGTAFPSPLQHPLCCLIGHVPSSLRIYEVSHVHLSWCVSIATKGLTLGSLGRRKIIQLKMYLAASGRAAERGLQAQRQLPAPTLVPCLPRRSELEIYLHSLEQEKCSPVGIPGYLQSGRSLEWYRAAFLAPGAFLVPTPCPLSPVWRKGMFKAASFTSHPLCDRSWHFL